MRSTLPNSDGFQQVCLVLVHEAFDRDLGDFGNLLVGFSIGDRIIVDLNIRVLICWMQCYLVIYCTVLYRTTMYLYLYLYCTVLYCTVLCRTVLYCAVLHCLVLYYTALHCIVLPCTAAYCTILHCTVPY